MVERGPGLLNELEALDRELREDPPRRIARARSLSTRRDSVRSRIDSEVLAKYDRLARSGPMPPVAGVEQGTCTGCRIRLPRQVIQDASATPGLVRCPSCGRVILVPGKLTEVDVRSSTPARGTRLP
jgi:predicted  nucleic acid-binding Zn-ribbon protein